MARFDYFVVLADMRTGSNFLEANINGFDGLSCHGEAFNPHFIGQPGTDDILGVTQAEREVNPQRLIDAIRDEEGQLGGFRLFSDHDPRALDIVLRDARCAKIVLSRNPVDSYVSWKIAAATGQWKLTHVRHARSERIVFDQAEFECYLEALQTFRIRTTGELQRSGQTAFHIHYDDLQDLNAINGLARFLGSPSRVASLDSRLKKQNPGPLSDKVRNFDEMREALARLDRFDLSRTPNLEPRRPAAVHSFSAAPDSPLLFLPIRSGPEDAVRQWLRALDGGGPLTDGFNQNRLRDWKARHPGHRSFTALRHPAARAHSAFCDRILRPGPRCFSSIRDSLRRFHDLPLPAGEVGPDYDTTKHRAAFLAFLGFLRSNLAGQTSLRIDPSWASQSAVLQGMAETIVPDMILREDRLEDDLSMLAAQVGKRTMPALPRVSDPDAALLARIWDGEVAAAVRRVYARDYDAFGFAEAP